MQKILLSYTVNIVATVYTVAISLLNFFLQKIYFVQKILQNFYAMKIGAIR